jgi:hypothetical protein
VLKKDHQDCNRAQSVEAGNPVVHVYVFQRACGNPSYDEKKRKKSRTDMGDFFPWPLPIMLTLDAIKAAKLAARLSVNPSRDDAVLLHADIRISDCCHFAHT